MALSFQEIESTVTSGEVRTPPFMSICNFNKDIGDPTESILDVGVSPRSGQDLLEPG
jgi:hypothetical protein